MTIFVFIGIESIGRVWALRISAFGMGLLFYIVGAIWATHPTSSTYSGVIPKSSQAMAAMIYLYCVMYSMGWGPVPWVYCADIFPTRTRAYGLGFASATQWLFNFIVSWNSLSIETNLGWKTFIMFATVNIGGMFVFTFFIPETKGRSLEEMDVIFGSVSKEQRDADIARAEVAHAAGRDNAFLAGEVSADKHSDEKLSERV